MKFTSPRGRKMPSRDKCLCPTGFYTIIMGPTGTHYRRTDVFSTKIKPRKHRYHYTVPSLDAKGRFVGPEDVQRGMDYFWVRRATATHGTLANGVVHGRACTVSPGVLRTMANERANGRSASEIAALVGVDAKIVEYHLHGSVAMARALAVEGGAHRP